MQLQERFAARILEERPESVLDVGCGSGILLERLRAAGVPSIGLDPSSKAMERVAEKGLEAIRGDAADLPFEDGRFDWVTMRHVAHHLADVPRSFAEALRVARRGFLVAEPWFDTSLASQRTAEALDLWDKRQYRHDGHVHDPVLGPREIFAALSSDAHFTMSSERYLDWREIPLEVVLEEESAVLAELAEGSEERVAFDAIVADIERDGITYNGTVICRIEKIAES